MTKKKHNWQKDPDTKSLNVLNVSGRRLIHKATELEGLRFPSNSDIALLTETWLHSGIFNSEFNLLGKLHPGKTALARVVAL